jgi:hypothetical protein
MQKQNKKHKKWKWHPTHLGCHWCVQFYNF